MVTLTTDKASSPRVGDEQNARPADGNLDGVVRATSRDLPVGSHLIRVMNKRRPCNECGELTNYVQHTVGTLWSWRLCWKHIAEDAMIVKYLVFVD